MGGRASERASERATDDPADAVFEALHTVMHLHRAQRQQALQGGPHELAPMEARVLGFFSRHPGATQSELAAHSGRDKGQLARLIGGLRERGLLEAVVDEHDRRITRLHPSSAARAVHQALQRDGRRLAAKAVAGLSAEERQQLLALLQRLQHNLQAG